PGPQPMSAARATPPLRMRCTRSRTGLVRSSSNLTYWATDQDIESSRRERSIARGAAGRRRSLLTPLFPSTPQARLSTLALRQEGEHGMAILALGLVIFLGLHSTRIVSESGRAKAIARLGEGPWKGIYSLLSAVGFVLIVWGFAEARYGAPALWTPFPGAQHL